MKSIEVDESSVRVEIEDPLRRETTEIPLDEIASVRTTQSILGRHMDSETLIVESTGGGSHKPVYGLSTSDSQRIQDAIDKRKE